jgi:type IV secretion system protein TrbI
MSTPPVTPQERAVMNALSGGRPKRNLHIYLMLAVGVLFLGLAAYKVLTRSSDTASRVAERPGPKAATEEPSPATLRELIQKQSTGGNAAKPELPRAAAPALPEPPKPAPPGPVSLDLDSHPAAEPGALPPADRGRGEPDRRIAEASYMTAKTEVYVQAFAPATGYQVNRPGDGESHDGLSRAVRASAGSTADAVSKLMESRELGIPGAKSTPDDRLGRRVRDQESFAAAPNRLPTAPLRAAHAPRQPYVAEGTPIRAVVARGVASNLPGHVEARVVSDVYDSQGHGQVLIPKGSRITGVYNANVAVGQERLQVAFTRLIFPSGASIALENAAAADSAGHSGMPGEVNHHYFRMLGSALAVGMLTYAVERRSARDAAAQAATGAVNVYSGAGATAGTVAAQTFANVTNQVLDRHLAIGPTITVRAGTLIHMQVARDLAIDPEVVL